MLGFHRDAAAEREVLAALGRLVVTRPVGGVDLDGRFARPHLDGAPVERAGEGAGELEPALRLRALRHLAGVEHPAVVIALADLEVAVGGIDPLADAPEPTEVERRVGDGLELAGRDLARVGRQVPGGGELHHVILDRAAGFALEVEVDVLGHVDRRGLVAGRAVFDAPDVLRGERIGDLRLDPAGEALVAVGRDVGEDDADVAALHEALGVPDVAVPAARAAVEVAADAAGRVIERGEPDATAVELERAVRDAVAVAADDRAPVGIARVPARRRIEADDHVLELAFAIGREEPDDLPAVVGHFHDDAASTPQGELPRLFSVFGDPERTDLDRRFHFTYLHVGWILARLTTNL